MSDRSVALEKQEHKPMRDLSIGGTAGESCASKRCDGAGARGTNLDSTKCVPRVEWGNTTNQPAARQSRRHRWCTTETAADVAVAVAVVATDTEIVDRALVWEAARPVALWVCKSRRADRLGAQQGAPSRDACAQDCTVLNPPAA